MPLAGQPWPSSHYLRNIDRPNLGTPGRARLHRRAISTLHCDGSERAVPSPSGRSEDLLFAGWPADGAAGVTALAASFGHRLKRAQRAASLKMRFTAVDDHLLAVGDVPPLSSMRPSSHASGRSPRASATWRRRATKGAR